MNSFFKCIGIAHHVSCPHAHQQNGSAERKHRHIVEMGLSLLAHALVPLKFWDEAFSTALYLINHLPSKVIGGDTPFSRLLKTVIQITHLCAHLDVRVGRILDHIMIRNSNLDQNGVYSWAIAACIRGLSAWIHLRVEFIFPGMSSLMKKYFLLPHYILTPELDSVLKFLFYLIFF